MAKIKKKMLISVDPATFKKVEALHKKLKISKSDLVQYAILDFIARDPQLALFKNDTSK